MIPDFDPRVIQLPPDLLEFATAVGQVRWANAERDGRKDRFGQSSVESHIMGACGEAAFCWCYGIRWDATEGTFGKVPDQQPDWEIRTATSLDYLKVLPKPTKTRTGDDPTRRVTFVLRLEQNRWSVLCRYIRARDAQNSYPLKDPGNREAAAHFVPYRDLLRVTDIEHTVHAYAGHGCIFGGEPSPWA